MKLSTKSRYGLNAMYHIALKGGEAPLSVTELSKETQVNQPYLEKILGQLAQKKLLVSSRGITGGYKLSKSPSEITIGEVLRALEKDLVFSDCAKSGKCNNINCPNKSIFKVIYDKLNNVLDDLTLQDMINNKGEM